jgi:hypothetical protein
VTTNILNLCLGDYIIYEEQDYKPAKSVVERPRGFNSQIPRQAHFQ